MPRQSDLPEEDRDRSLEEVIADFGRCLRPDGPYGPIDDDWSVYDESFRRIVRWAEDNDCFYDGLEPEREGGREHDVWYDRETSAWVKFTKPAQAGYCVTPDELPPHLLPGLPQQYLGRLVLQNEVFSDDVRFVGVGGSRREPRIITRQSDIVGEAATDEQIVTFMVDVLGFAQLNAEVASACGYKTSLGFIHDRIAVFDLRSANVVRTPDGLIVPIDSIPVRFEAQTATELMRFLA